VTDSLATQTDFYPQDGTQSSASSNTDTLRSAPIMVRTITIRGFDASDETVDRERLLNNICSAAPVIMDDGKPSVVFHSGLLGIAREVKKEVEKYIDFTCEQHKIVLNGHSIGGSLSLLVLLMLANERGPSFVKNKILRVYTYGSPPIASYRPGSNAINGDRNGVSDLDTNMNKDGEANRNIKKKIKSNSRSMLNVNGNEEKTAMVATSEVAIEDRSEFTRKQRPTRESDFYKCDILRYFGLPSNIVYGYVQPWVSAASQWACL